MEKFTYYLCIPIDNTTANVLSMTFDIGRYGILTETIKFDHLVTEKEAIETAEQILNEPMTQSHLTDLITADDLFIGRDDLFGGDDATLSDYPMRWRALGDAHFLERIEHNGTHINIWCGS